MAEGKDNLGDQAEMPVIMRLSKMQSQRERKIAQHQEETKERLRWLADAKQHSIVMQSTSEPIGELISHIAITQ